MRSIVILGPVTVGALITLLPAKSTVLLPFRHAPLNSAQSLRVGVVVDNGNPSPWVDALLSFLKQLPALDVRLFTLRARPGTASKRPSWVTDRLYSASRARFDPFGDITVGGTERASPEFVGRIKDAYCGILLWLADCKDPSVDLSGMAKHGAFTVRWGKRNRIIPFWDEVVNGETTTGVTMYWHDSSLVRGRAVRTLETSTSQRLYLTLNAEDPINATIRTMASLCLQLRQDGREFEHTLRAIPEDSVEAPSHGTYPTSLEVGRFVIKKLAKSAHLRWKARGKEGRWFVAIRRNSGRSITDPTRLDLTGFREVPLPAGTEAMADPFLWSMGGKDYLLFEQLTTSSSRGQIGCVEVFANGSRSETNIILERPYHLSYPCVVPDRGELFLLPESSEAERVDLYRFSRFPSRLELIAPLIEGLALVDTTPVFVDGRWYFFTTTKLPFLETLLFWSDRLDGAWNLHPSSPISCSVRNSRSAGSLFWRNGRLYRPTQDCSVRYGYAIQVNEVLRLTPTEFEERTVNRIPPTWHLGLLGTHTWNESNGLQVLDGIRLVNRTPEVTSEQACEA